MPGKPEKDPKIYPYAKVYKRDSIVAYDVVIVRSLLDSDVFLLTWEEVKNGEAKQIAARNIPPRHQGTAVGQRLMSEIGGQVGWR